MCGLGVWGLRFRGLGFGVFGFRVTIAYKAKKTPKPETQKPPR